eukprot:7126795-Pyramimonas_sp.AAC.1
MGDLMCVFVAGCPVTVCRRTGWPPRPGTLWRATTTPPPWASSAATRCLSVCRPSSFWTTRRRTTRCRPHYCR